MGSHHHFSRFGIHQATSSPEVDGVTMHDPFDDHFHSKHDHFQVLFHFELFFSENLRRFKVFFRRHQASSVRLSPPNRFPWDVATYVASPPASRLAGPRPWRGLRRSGSHSHPDERDPGVPFLRHLGREDVKMPSRVPEESRRSRESLLGFGWILDDFGASVVCGISFCCIV